MSRERARTVSVEAVRIGQNPTAEKLKDIVELTMHNLPSKLRTRNS